MKTRLSEGSFTSTLVTLFAIAAMLAIALPLGVATAGENTFEFNMVPSSAAISACLPHASGEVTIETGDLNDKMVVHVSGLAPNTGYDLFVIEVPHGPFGISWYQSDLQTDEHGRGHAKMQGVFDVETFSVSPAGSPTVSFPPTHQYHLGLWFDDPQVPFDLGCEPGRTTPSVTPFNGDQHAGIQVLNTGNFPDDAGPLSQIHR
jgi:hypothetical protein